MLGRWDESLTTAAQIPDDRVNESVTLSILSSVVEIQIARGNVAEARRVRELYPPDPPDSPDVQEESSFLAADTALLHAEGRFEEALATGLKTLASVPGDGAISYQQSKQALVHATEAALALGLTRDVEDMLARIDNTPARPAASVHGGAVVAPPRASGT